MSLISECNCKLGGRTFDAEFFLYLTPACMLASTYNSIKFLFFIFILCP